MFLSVFDMFKVGIGPSSSHTMGPMVAAARFLDLMRASPFVFAGLRASLHGSLAFTGVGHATDRATILGLAGFVPETYDANRAETALAEIAATGRVTPDGLPPLRLDPKTDLIFDYDRTLPGHANGMTLMATDAEGDVILQETYYSVGGGFVVDETATGADRLKLDDTPLPYPFRSGAELLTLCQTHQMSISQVMLENEKSWRSEADIRAGLLHIWQVMQACVERGCHTEGTLPGVLNVKRRAADLYRKLTGQREEALRDPLNVIDWVNLYALAVNEENAAGGRVVTAPTNGAAGIIPAVLHYWHRFGYGADDDSIVRFLLTAGAIGILYKENASISGADVGCQGEVGVACSMAAAALCEVRGGSPAQVENAAEIGMEHNLGLTCDPVGGLVQIPCIERNAMASVKAINAARIALRGDGTHYVSLDKVIKTMRQTGADMKTKYKETARGGLAVNVIEC